MIQPFLRLYHKIILASGDLYISLTLAKNPQSDTAIRIELKTDGIKPNFRINIDIEKQV